MDDGVRSLFAGAIGEDVEEASKASTCAWKLSRHLAPSKKAVHSKTVDAKEFHAFIVAFRCYLELAELFEHLDAQHEDDQKLSLRECRKGMEQLAKWGVREAELREKFEGLDSWEPKWKFDDFAKFCIEHRYHVMTLDLELDTDDEEVLSEQALALTRQTSNLRGKCRHSGAQLKENRMAVMNTFKRWDADYSGKISEEEFESALEALGPEFTPAIAKKIVHLADANHDGTVDYEEFCLWIFAPSIDDA